MTYQDDLFFSRDKHQYILENNEEFLKWYLISMEDGIHCNDHLNITDFQNLIDTLTNFYHLRYPDYLLESIPSNFSELQQVNSHKNELTTRQIIGRLPKRLQGLIDCNYGVEGNNVGRTYVSENGAFLPKDYERITLYSILDSKNDCAIYFDQKTGIVLKSNCSKYEGHYLEEILQALNNSHNSLVDYSELEEVVRKHQYELELRHRLLQLTTLKILYSGTTPEMSYSRAKAFIFDMNRELGSLLSTDEINELIDEYRKAKGYQRIK